MKQSGYSRITWTFSRIHVMDLIIFFIQCNAQGRKQHRECNLQDSRFYTTFSFLKLRMSGLACAHLDWFWSYEVNNRASKHCNGPNVWSVCSLWDSNMRFHGGTNTYCFFHFHLAKNKHELVEIDFQNATTFEKKKKKLRTSLKWPFYFIQLIFWSESSQRPWTNKKKGELWPPTLNFEHTDTVFFN